MLDIYNFMNHTHNQNNNCSPGLKLYDINMNEYSNTTMKKQKITIKNNLYKSTKYL